MVAAERCSRYHVDGYNLVIRDVAEEDAGVYTILTGIQQFKLHQNLSLSLVVNGKLVCILCLLYSSGFVDNFMNIYKYLVKFYKLNNIH